MKSLRSCRRAQVQRWTVFRRSCRSPYQTQTHHLHRTAGSCHTGRAVEKPDSPPSTHPLSNMMLLKSVLKLVRHAALVIGFDLRIWRDQMHSGEWLQKIARKQLPDRATFAPCLDSQFCSRNDWEIVGKNYAEFAQLLAGSQVP